jgi:hypothetical protein
MKLAPHKPILVLDFDGVIHSYTSGWQGADVVSDPPVPGAMAFILKAAKAFKVAIFSSRSGQIGGIEAMQEWLQTHLAEHISGDTFLDGHDADSVARVVVYGALQWPTEKPPAMLTIDDRAITFTGQWPDMEDLLTFQPWNKRDPKET